jgi:hypothetical protein
MNNWQAQNIDKFGKWIAHHTATINKDEGHRRTAHAVKRRTDLKPTIKDFDERLRT